MRPVTLRSAQGVSTQLVSIITVVEIRNEIRKSVTFNTRKRRQKKVTKKLHPQQLQKRQNTSTSESFRPFHSSGDGDAVDGNEAA
jgi:phage protein D